MKKKGIYNRYSFLKKMNKNSLILIKGKNKYITFDRDLEILKYINFRFEYQYCSLSYLDKYNINYIVLDNLSVIIDKTFELNNYRRYLKLMYLSKILKKIGNI